MISINYFVCGDNKGTIRVPIQPLLYGAMSKPSRPMYWRCKLLARELAKELEKQPSAGEGAIYLPRRSVSFSREEAETVPVSAGIWEKFNVLSNVCESCHSGFRGANW